MAGSSTELALPDRPRVAALASAQNATASPIAKIWLGTCLSVRKCAKLLCAQPEAAAAPIARISAMIDFQGLVLAFTLATCADRSICVPSDKCIGPILPA